MTLKELRELRAKHISDARGLLDTAKAEKRNLTDDESAQYDKLFAAADEVRQQISREERQTEAERELQETLASDEERAVAGGADAGEQRGNTDALMATFRGWLTSGIADGEGMEEIRALSAGVGAEGGFLVMPEVMVNSLIKALDDEVVIRQLANVIPQSQGASIGIPSLDSDPDDGDWTEELATGSEDSGMGFGKRVMQPHPMAKRIKISQQLMRTSAIPAETLVLQRLAYKLGLTQEKAYLTGNGVKRPLGLFVASNDGISTSRDISADNAATKPTMDGLKNAKYALKAGYWAKSNWLFHRDVVKEIAKLVDGNGQYIWSESVRENEPDRLLGRPVIQSEYAPNTMTTGQYVGLVGDFSNYWILDALQTQIQRLNELYAEKNQIGFIGRYEGDGAPVLQEAFARVKLG